MRVFVFDGQGSTPSSSTLTSTSPLGTVFLQECTSAFSRRMESLSDQEILRIGFSREALRGIVFPVACDEASRDPLVSMPNLFIEQMLRLIQLLDTRPDTLSCSSREHSMHVLGYSSGLLTALFVATSDPSALSRVSFMQRSLFIFDVAVSLGIHSQLSRFDMFESAGVSLDDPERGWNWSSAVLGLELSELDQLVQEYNEKNGACDHKVRKL